MDIPLEEENWKIYQTQNEIVVLLNELYRIKNLDIKGDLAEVGVYMGGTLKMMADAFPDRDIYGFDTFEGFPNLHEKDGDMGSYGDFNVPHKYPDYLRNLLQYHENECPNSHIRKFDLINGDVCDTLPQYLSRNPETVIALAYLDLDIYEPTKAVLNAK